MGQVFFFAIFKYLQIFTKKLFIDVELYRSITICLQFSLLRTFSYTFTIVFRVSLFITNNFHYIRLNFIDLYNQYIIYMLPISQSRDKSDKKRWLRNVRRDNTFQYKQM